MELPKLSLLRDKHHHTFVVPVKRINEGHDVQQFLVSKAHHDLMLFVLQLNRAIFPCRLSRSNGSGAQWRTWELDSYHDPPSHAVRRLQGLLHRLNAVIDEVPPDPGPRRFGNVAFRQWYEAVEARLPDFLQDSLPEQVLLFSHSSNVSVQAELQSYLLGAFGSAQRLDYGTGHELAFLAFLGCIWKLGGFDVSSGGDEERAIVLGLIEPYLQLIRRLIKTYTLEPAGSHGVWGLDDHSFLPYLFGSAQYGPAISATDETPVEGSLSNAPDPADVTKTAVVERERGRNMYFSAIGFIYDVKKGPFWEHSPMLYDISGVRSGWAKINKGMIKMYMAEVLSKFPVVQHFYFGSLFSWDRDPNAAPPPSSVHTSNQPSTSQPEKTESNAILLPLRNVQNEGPTTAHGPVSATPSSAFVGTAAPWAKQPRVKSPTTAFPSQMDQRNISQTPRLPPNVNPRPVAAAQSGGQAAATGMPPPTRAPWAKYPGT
ncbi:MAG: hypothetical protein LQ345_001128 [Seirophora villosa]|nr:MAG: hypothetical protein LQ345_001128 [Seirophora villosa]